MQYPVDQLRPRSGNISAMIFKNALVGVEETLFWTIEIDFEPLEFDGESNSPSLASEWFTLPVRDWRDLENQTVEGDDDAIESSFYVFEHDSGSWTKINIGNRAGYSFDIKLDLKVELLGLDAMYSGPGPSVQPATICVRMAVPFVGVHIDEHLLDARLASTVDALNVASRYVDLRSYKDVRISGRRFIFDPLDD